MNEPRTFWANSLHFLTFLHSPFVCASGGHAGITTALYAITTASVQCLCANSQQRFDCETVFNSFSNSNISAMTFSLPLFPLPCILLYLVLWTGWSVWIYVKMYHLSAKHINKNKMKPIVGSATETYNIIQSLFRSETLFGIKHVFAATCEAKNSFSFQFLLHRSTHTQYMCAVARCLAHVHTTSASYFVYY